ncbi:MAG: hypothetical protein LBF63_00785 [Treponema sp.]|jgi:hypothetical protein|nr:hypothetical protein [Treponema sp.]
MAGPGEKRELGKTVKRGLQIRDMLLIGILLAAGVVLRTAVGTVINFGMKPNFIIAMYCLTILLIRPGIVEAAIIGLLSGALCQFFPGQPYINFVSELLGALAMCLFIRIPVVTGNAGLLRTALEAARIIGCTFLSTLVSGFSFIGVMYLMYYAGAGITPTPLAIFLAIIFGTALINSIIVQILYIPLKLALKRNND